MAVIRIGQISKVDKENGMAEVTYSDQGDGTTGMFPIMNPFLTFKADRPGHICRREDCSCEKCSDPLCRLIFRFPKVGEYVVVAHLSNGITKGVILGSYWNEADKPVEGE